MTTIPKDKAENFLENSLVVSVFTEDSDLVKRLILNPTIKNISIKKPTTDFELSEPHEGNIVNFLYDFKSVRGFAD